MLSPPFVSYSGDFAPSAAGRQLAFGPIRAPASADGLGGREQVDDVSTLEHGSVAAGFRFDEMEIASQFIRTSIAN